ncbi:hypothetical protein DPEC_G00253750 [Dallia pectoralis]|uniref:Uncharacterized protein n=1 Tax=Dallia pectoralis TaxID=75939 RepID=A0ACC2FU25_DALPE|nr:hypothetical protein DPEC_G00253750 [Dallia pectoralis]
MLDLDREGGSDRRRKERGAEVRHTLGHAGGKWRDQERPDSQKKEESGRDGEKTQKVENFMNRKLLEW